MSYPYVYSTDAEIQYDAKGVSMKEMPLDKDFPDIQKCGIKFYRCNVKAGCTVSPKLDPENIVLLIFNGKRAYIRSGCESFDVVEPSFFIPDFDKQAYTVGIEIQIQEGPLCHISTELPLSVRE